MPLTQQQKDTVKAIVSVFETGTIGGPSSYSTVTLLKGDTGRLTYGRHQTTIASGGLYLLLRAYCDNPQAMQGPALKPWLDRVRAKALVCDTDFGFKAMLKLAGADPVMKNIQNSFFDSQYWAKAEAAYNGRGFTTALAFAVVYDSMVHGSWTTISKRIDARYKNVPVSEQTWISNYVAERAIWLSTHKNALLAKTLYRMKSMRELITQDNWNLNLPLTVHGVVISETALNAL